MRLFHNKTSLYIQLNIVDLIDVVVAVVVAVVAGSGGQELGMMDLC